MTSPSVAVIVPTFDRAALLAQCLDSLWAQTLAPSQVIVVDDGSVDETAGIISAAPSMVEAVTAPQVGKSGAVNVALGLVRSNYVWILDDDDVAVPDALERLVEPLEASPELGFTFGRMYLSSSDPVTGTIGEPGPISWLPPDAGSDLLLALLRTNFLGGATLFARTSVYDEVGPFDETLVRSQDYDMAIRIARRFRGVEVRGGPTFHYRQHPGMRGPRRARFPAAARERQWLLYDQMLFRRLRTELDLAELVPANHANGSTARVALLHRAAIMASKLLVDEAVHDVAAAADACDGSLMQPTERLALQRVLASHAIHAPRGVLDDTAAVAALDAVAKGSSRLAVELRRELRHLRLVRAYRRYVPKPVRLLRRRVADRRAR